MFWEAESGKMSGGLPLPMNSRQKNNSSAENPAGRAARLIAALFVGLFSTLSCSPEPTKGNLEIRVKDHRVAIGDFSRLEASIDAIRLKPSGNWIELKPSLESFDLTAYANGASVTVFKGQIESAPIEGIHLKLSKIRGTLKKSKAAVEVKNGVGPVQLPFSLDPKAGTLLIMDLKVVDLSDHAGRSYELLLNGYELYRDGKLLDKIPPG
jgi:hypothetical protein